VPASLLLLSRALYLPEKLPQEDQLKAALSSLPGEMVDEATIKAKEIEGEIVDNRLRLDVVKKQEERIKEEEEEEGKKEEVKAAIAVQQEELKDVAPVLTPSVGISATDTGSLEEVVVSKEELRDIGEAVSLFKKPLSEEESTLEELKEDREEFQSDIADLNTECSSVAPEEQLEESVSSSRLGKRVDNMISKIDSTLKQLREEVKQDLHEPATFNQQEDTVTVQELAEAIRKTRKTSDEQKIQRICEVLDDDQDGAVKVDDLLKAIELIASEDTDLNAKQISTMMAILKKEGQITGGSFQ
jgi:LETM1 and EF-hand domain-containing protein 1